MFSGGILKIGDPHYLEREEDNVVKKAITNEVSIISIVGPHQSGKSSLLIRCLQFAREKDYQVVLIDLQSLGVETLSTEELFVSHLIEQISKQFNFDFDKVWTSIGSRSPYDKLNLFLDKYAIEAVKKKLILAFDKNKYIDPDLLIIYLL